MLQSRRPTLSVAAALCAALLTGCHLLQPIATALRNPKNLFDASAENELPPIVASRDAISLELVFIERQVGDPLLGRALWNDVDQVGVMQPETRARLASNGFRVGHVGPTPPQALQTLLKLTDDALDLGNPSDSSRAMQIRRVTLTSDMETEVHAAPQYAECLVRVVGSAGETERSFTQALCQFRLKARRLQEGWAQIELTPEILHSRSAMRHVVAKNQWQLQQGKKHAPLYDQKFTVRLNKGEMAVVTAAPANPGSLGHTFFRGPQADSHVQRLLVIRLADIQQVKPVYAE